MANREKVLGIAAGVACSAAVAYLSWTLLKKLLGKEEWEKVGNVASLHVYPIKSCKGIQVQEIQLDKYGAVNDRRFMVIDAGTKRFVSQRQIPKMCMISVKIMGAGSVQLSAPGDDGEEDTYLFKPRVEPLEGEGLVPAGIWDDEVQGVDQGSGVAAWLSLFLEREVQLLGMGATYTRATDSTYTPRTSLAQAAFSDGFPLLLLSNESLEELNGRLGSPVPMDRFRPNIVVHDVARPFAEDSWRRIRIGEQEMEVVKPCSRCKIPTTNQETGEQGAEPAQTLASFRNKAHVRAPCGDKVDVFFGQNVCHFAAGGRVCVGDQIYAMRVRYPWSSK